MSRLTGDWRAAERWFDQLREAPAEAKRVALTRAAMYLRDAIVKGIRDQAPGGRRFAKLAAFTIYRRRNRLSAGYRRRVERGQAGGGQPKALIDHGDLLAAITFQVDPNGTEAFVGVLRQSVRKTDQPSGRAGSMVDIASVHEYGATIRVTDKMRGWFRWQGWPLKPSTTHITIPARPFIRPTWEAEADAVREVFWSAFREVMGLG